MPIILSEAADALLRLRFDHQPVEVTDETRPAYRELAAAGIMIPLHTFTKGRESAYRFTEAGWALRDESLNAPSSPAPSPAGSVAPHR
jgi:hypothetical protein